MKFSQVNTGDSLTLGVVKLRDLAEGAIHWVPGQQVVIHRFPGGARTFDIMGKDSDVIKWQATLFGNDAQDLAAEIRNMAETGDPVPLTWNNFTAQVIIKDVAFDQQSKYMIAYNIECYVMQDADGNSVTGGGLGVVAAIMNATA